MLSLISSRKTAIKFYDADLAAKNNDFNTRVQKTRRPGMITLELRSSRRTCFFPFPASLSDTQSAVIFSLIQWNADVSVAGQFHLPTVLRMNSFIDLCAVKREKTKSNQCSLCELLNQQQIPTVHLHQLSPTSCKGLTASMELLCLHVFKRFSGLALALIQWYSNQDSAWFVGLRCLLMVMEEKLNIRVNTSCNAQI